MHVYELNLHIFFIILLSSNYQVVRIASVSDETGNHAYMQPPCMHSMRVHLGSDPCFSSPLRRSLSVAMGYSILVNYMKSLEALSKIQAMGCMYDDMQKRMTMHAFLKL